jgi:N-acetylglucosaminyldiphosphoundecaprenol N-acetyl-beta-D-mannosaminyltransferase
VRVHPAIVIAGVRIHALDLSGAAQAVLEAALRRQPFSAHLCNAYVLALASRDRGYAALLERGELKLADGAPVAWFAGRAGTKLEQRPSGAELLLEVVRGGLAEGLRHFFYGSTPAVLAALTEELRARYPGVEIVGAHSPPFGPVTSEQADEVVAQVDASGAHIVWVGLGTPKQDELVDRLRGRTTGACVPIGAAFDFVAGTQRRAPVWMRRLGLEWAHRLATEPRRLWRRYLWGNARFLWSLTRTGRIIHRADVAQT